MYPQVFGKYVLERELARGGMARVLLATLRGAGGFEKKLVVKQIRDDLALDEDFVRRFVEEAKTTVALSHPNIVPVYELGVERGTYFLAMELVEGVSVAELLRDEQPPTRDKPARSTKKKLTPEEGAYIGVEICRALDYAHRRMQVVHRDITPRNVMIDEEGQVKLIDFGIAARAAAVKDPAARDRQVFGSPGHMPPEQMAGKQLGPPTDLFALAVLLMEAWSGHAPFRRKSPEESEAAMHEKHPKASDGDIRLLTLDDPISRAMSLDPADRQQDADDLGRALRKFLQEVDLGDVARGLGERARETRERARAREERATTPELPDVDTPHEGESATATFAARDEIKKLSEAPPAMDPIDVGTRKLAFLTPPVISKEKVEELAKAAA
ncbi:MAG: serine/threonine protein kinase, partial [Polyangiaceae bacterium]